MVQLTKVFSLCFVMAWLSNFVARSAGISEELYWYENTIANDYYYTYYNADETKQSTPLGILGEQPGNMIANDYYNTYYNDDENKETTPLGILGEASTGYITTTPQNTQNTQPSTTQRSVVTMTSLPFTSSSTTHSSVETMTSSPRTSASTTLQGSTQRIVEEANIPSNTPTHSIVEKKTSFPNSPLSSINALDDELTASPNSSVRSTIRQDKETTSPPNTPASSTHSLFEEKTSPPYTPASSTKSSIAETSSPPNTSLIPAQMFLQQSTTKVQRTTEFIAPNLKQVRLNQFDVAKLFYKKLLTNYDRRIRPIQNQTHPVYVNTKFVPLSLIDFDTYAQRFSMLGYFRIRWTDEQMVWRPRFHGLIDTVKFASADIWTPNIVIHKSFDGHSGVGNPKTDILMVFWNGMVQWVPDSTYSVVCDVDIQYFPFDDQTCTVKYYAADETLDTVELDHYLGTDMSEYSENPSWLIVGASRKRYVKENNWCIDVKFRVRRRANFAMFTLITPLLMLAFLNISVFLVPINSGEKGSFSVTMFLSYGIFFTMISDSLPHNSLQISFFILLIVALPCLSVVAVFYTVIQAKLVSVIGSKQCPITCLRKLRWSKVNKVTPIEHIIENGIHDPEDEPYTWKDFLEQLDTFLFVLFLIIILLITSLFFAILMRHVANCQ